MAARLTVPLPGRLSVTKTTGGQSMCGRPMASSLQTIARSCWVRPFLTEPRRGRVVGAQLLTGALVGIATGLVAALGLQRVFAAVVEYVRRSRHLAGRPTTSIWSPSPSCCSGCARCAPS